MNNNDFKIPMYIKNFIMLLEKIMINYPRREYELRNRLIYDSYSLLELVYETNYLDISLRKPLQIKALSKINMLDFYIEYSYKKKIISEKQSMSLSRNLNIINKMIYGWIKNGS